MSKDVLLVQVHNPATNEEIAHVPLAGAKETERAIAAAAQAFPAWKARTAKERAGILRKCVLTAKT